MDTHNEGVLYLPLLNVESEHCALIIEKKLAQIGGINACKVELNNKRAAITVSNNGAVLEAISAIKNLGYDVSIAKGTYPVLGMTCASCASSAETILKNHKGVINAAVNFATGNLYVEYLPNTTDIFDLQKTVQSVGYDLLIKDENEQQRTLEKLNEENQIALQRKTIWAVILSVPVVVIGMFFMDMPYANLIMCACTTRLFFG